jgi:hypothetical protein
VTIKSYRQHGPQLNVKKKDRTEINNDKTKEEGNSKCKRNVGTKKSTG